MSSYDGPNTIYAALALTLGFTWATVETSFQEFGGISEVRGSPVYVVIIQLIPSPARRPFSPRLCPTLFVVVTTPVGL
ncbi:hypothetical protein BDN71DRAFT_1454072 [Pleurotus eryngii]|uniref:Uncharacterized protein n=1 Tax=Pleurotus eryngii TaxID=5323 RepID=A0A9P5ZQL9_PLEER|nr:hypothetical protein BDN71DRAFT_1454072 [Pleurotus eryngii]